MSIRRWAAAQLPFALAFLGLTPSQFYSFTISEWGSLIKGWEARRETEIHEKAVIAANIMASSGNLKKGTSFKDLYNSIARQLKGEESKPKKAATDGESLAKFKRRFGVA